MKILYFITQSTWGGAQRYIYDLAVNLDPRKFEVLVAAGGDGELLKKLKKTGIKTYSLKYLKRSINLYYEIRAFFEILNLLKKEKFDIIHINSSKGTVLAALAGKLTKTKVVYTVHGSVFMACFPWLIKKFWFWIEKIFSCFKDKIIFVSEFDRQFWLKYKITSLEKLVTVYNGINISKMKFLSQKKGRKRLLITNYQLPITGTVAHLYLEKGIKYLIEAAKIVNYELRTRNQELIFIVIGKGPERNKLEKLIKKYNLEKKFFLLGEIENASRYLKIFDFFILPSVKEGLPYTILEAMAAELPIIASKVGGIPEMIEDNKNGFLVKPRNSEALAEKIVWLINHPKKAQELGQNAYQKVVEKFTLEKMVEETKEVYVKLKTQTYNH